MSLSKPIIMVIIIITYHYLKKNVGVILYGGDIDGDDFAVGRFNQVQWNEIAIMVCRNNSCNGRNL